MAKSKHSKNIDRWVRNHTDKHLCACGCGYFIEIKREHYRKSIGIPDFIKGHNRFISIEVEEPEEDVRSIWEKLTPEEQARRISLLRSFGKGEDNPAWKGGRVIDDNGYILIRCQDHPFAKDGYVFEHRYVVEEWTKEHDPDNPLLIVIDGNKYLKPTAVVHHIDEVKTNNDKSNLMLLPHQSAHAFIHKSSLPMEERIRRIKLGIFHSRPLEEEDT